MYGDLQIKESYLQGMQGTDFVQIKGYLRKLSLRNQEKRLLVCKVTNGFTSKYTEVYLIRSKFQRVPCVLGVGNKGVGCRG